MGVEASACSSGKLQRGGASPTPVLRNAQQLLSVLDHRLALRAIHDHVPEVDGFPPV